MVQILRLDLCPGPAAAANGATQHLSAREVDVLRLLAQDHSYEEMMEITGAGLSALKMRVKRACEQLREQLEGVHDA